MIKDNLFSVEKDHAAKKLPAGESLMNRSSRSIYTAITG